MVKHIESMARSLASRHPAVTGVLAVLGVVVVGEGIYSVLKPKTSTAQSTATPAAKPGMFGGLL